MPERGVRAEGLQQRQVAAQAVEGANRGLCVGHADVDVQTAHRRRDRVAEQLADPLVALLVGDRRIAFAGRRVGARAEQPGARGDHRGAQLGECLDRLSGRAADVRDQLDLTGVQLALDGPRDRAEPRLHRRGSIRLTARHGIHEEQLLLDPNREGSL